jgi:hypothetical protein
MCGHEIRPLAMSRVSQIAAEVDAQCNIVPTAGAGQVGNPAARSETGSLPLVSRPACYNSVTKRRMT